MSLIVASGVDFFAGISAAGDELLLGVALGLVLAAGDEDLLGEGEVSAFVAGAGEALFSVATETVGSEGFSAAVASGDGAGGVLSSWARAIEAAAVKRAAVTARTVSFI
jgi:hypothetical protein